MSENGENGGGPASAGPLRGLRVVELGGIGPGPFGSMLLADLGADVIRVEHPDAVRAAAAGAPSADFVLTRGRRSIGVDLKHPEGVAVVLRLVEEADALVEGYRPGVAERLGVGPEACEARNQRLVYARMTGWGQDGPRAGYAGHDINYISLSGALHPIGRAGEAPVPPLNLVGDFGGGGAFLALGVLAAVMEARASGRGQVVDVAMVDGSALLLSVQYGMRALGMWSDERGTNLLDSGAPFYEVYETADGQYVSIGALEPQFYADFLRRLGPEAADLPPQGDVAQWPAAKKRLAEIFAGRTRAEWCEILDGPATCFAPVLSMSEAHLDPHNQARGTYVTVDGVLQPGPAPRFSRTPAPREPRPSKAGGHTDDLLAGLGMTEAEIAALREAGAVA